MKDMTIALLGQPNSGKSTLFNKLTGLKQHVGNWPGKTVEQKTGYFTHNKNKYTIVDLPGTYSLSANSEEEVVTREYIATEQADLVCILADASQLERSLFMLADYTGIKTSTILLLNMMDVAKEQGKIIKCSAISKKLGIPVVPITAADGKTYDEFFKVLDDFEKNSFILGEKEIFDLYNENIGDSYKEIFDLLPKEGIGVYSSAWLTSKLIEEDELAIKIVKPCVNSESQLKINNIISKTTDGSLLTGSCKFKWIDNLLKDNIKKGNSEKVKISKFDKIATSKIWGKPLVIGSIILGLIFSLILAVPFMIIFSTCIPALSKVIAKGLVTIGTPYLLISLLCDGVLSAVSFAFQMASFIFGISLIFGLLEEIGYMARISYVFDNTMSRLGLQGKAVMPFLVSFGCNIGGVSGTRVIDSWGQRVTTIALSWVVPCSATWGVVGLMSSVFFGGNAIWVILSLFAVAFLHMYITSKIFSPSLIKDGDKNGLIMELPPYHKPRYKNLFRFVLNRLGDVLKRALKVIISISVIFWALSYSPDGNVSNSIIYKIGNIIEPVTMWFGLRWQTFMAFLASAMGKEAALGVLSSLFTSGTNTTGLWGIIANAKSTVVDTSSLGSVLISTISKPEALAFIYAFFFNIPCLMTIGATLNESHSSKWTLRITLYYIIVALLMATAAYHIGILIF